MLIFTHLSAELCLLLVFCSYFINLWTSQFPLTGICLLFKPRKRSQQTSTRAQPQQLQQQQQQQPREQLEGPPMPALAYQLA